MSLFTLNRLRTLEFMRPGDPPVPDPSVMLILTPLIATESKLRNVA